MTATTHPVDECGTCARLAANVAREADRRPGGALVADRCGAHEASADPRITAGR